MRQKKSSIAELRFIFLTKYKRTLHDLYATIESYFGINGVILFRLWLVKKKVRTLSFIFDEKESYISFILKS